jgi:hypothetical protein
VASMATVEAAGRDSSLSIISSTCGSVTGVIGASSSLLWLLHSMDSPDDFGDGSGCELDLAGRATGISRGSEGTGSSG